MNKITSNKELKNFYVFSIGQFTSQFGSKLTSYGLILWSYKQSGSVLSTALLMVSYLLPSILLSFIAGSISDKWNKKMIMLITDAIAAIFSILLITMLIADTLRIEYLYVINIILGITNSIQNPAFNVTISLIVSTNNYMKTSGIRSFFNSFLDIFSPIIATSLYAFHGLKTIVLVDLTTFIFAFITLALFVYIPKMPVSIEEKSISLFGQCKLGIRFLLKKKGVLKLILFMSFVNFIAGIYTTNLAPMVLLRSGNNDVQLGFVSGAIGIAGLFGSILVTKIPQTIKRIPLILNSISFSFLVCHSLLGVGRNYYIWMIAVFLGNILIPLVTANVEYIMRIKVPLNMQGRVFSARNTLQYISIPIGNLIGGLLSDKVFEPYMIKASILQSIFSKIVGFGDGGGIALLYLCIGIVGFIGCCLFRLSKDLILLEEK